MNLARNKVWFSLLGVLSVILVVLLVQTALGKDGDPSGKEPAKQTEAPEEGLKVNAYPKVNALIQKYYSASTHGNVETLKQIVVPFTDQDQAVAVRKSEFVESYENINCYTEDGVDPNTYIAFVNYDLKFPNVDTPAPGLEAWIIFTDEKGELYINNDRSTLSEAMESQIQSLEARDDVKALMQDVENRMAQALQADPNLRALCEQMGMTDSAGEGTTPPDDSDTTVTATPAPVGDVKKEMMAVMNLEIYADAQKSSVVDSISVGSTLWADQNIEGGLTLIDRNGITGYVQTSGLAAFETVDEELTVTVNYYSSCDPSGTVAGTITSDSPCYCSLRFDNGWRQLIVNGNKVYVKEADLGITSPAVTQTPEPKASASPTPSESPAPSTEKPKEE